MDIEIFTLCDAAADYNGRLNILGTFDTIFAAQLPAIHPYCSVALRIRFEPIEKGPHPLVLHIVDNDGGLVIPAIEGTFNVDMPAGAPMATANLVFNLGGLPLTRYGEHAVKLAIDGRQEASLPFWVKEPTGKGR